MATGITFTYHGASHVVPVTASSTKADLQKACAERIGLPASAWKDVVAFTSGQVLYPPSYLLQFAQSGTFTNKILSVIVRGDGKESGGEVNEGSGSAEGHGSMRFDIGEKAEMVVEMNARDLKAFALVKERSKLGGLDLKKLYSCFRRHSDGAERLSKDGFDACIRELVPGDQLSRAEKQFLSFGLSKIFHAFDRDGDDTVDFNEFITGFSILALGREEEKLQFAFALFDADRDGFIDKAELTTYFRAFLTAVLALNSDIVRLNADYVNDLIERTARRMCLKALDAADQNKDGRLSYEEMYAWYRNGGDILMPWLSLVASSPVLPAAVTDLRPDAYEDDHPVRRVDDPEVNGSSRSREAFDAESEEEETLMQFPLLNDEQLEIGLEDVATLNNVLDATKLGNVDAQQIIKAFVQVSQAHRSTTNG